MCLNLRRHIRLLLQRLHISAEHTHTHIQTVWYDSCADTLACLHSTEASWHDQYIHKLSLSHTHIEINAEENNTRALGQIHRHLPCDTLVSRAWYHIRCKLLAHKTNMATHKQADSTWQTCKGYIVLNLIILHMWGTCLNTRHTAELTSFHILVMLQSLVEFIFERMNHLKCVCKYFLWLSHVKSTYECLLFGPQECVTCNMEDLCWTSCWEWM